MSDVFQVCSWYVYHQHVLSCIFSNDIYIHLIYISSNLLHVLTLHSNPTSRGNPTFLAWDRYRPHQALVIHGASALMANSPSAIGHMLRSNLVIFAKYKSDIKTHILLLDYINQFQCVSAFLIILTKQSRDRVYSLQSWTNAATHLSIWGLNKQAQDDEAPMSRQSPHCVRLCRNRRTKFQGRKKE